MITSKDESSLIFERQTVVLGNLFLQPSFVRKEYLFFTTKLIARMIHWIEKRKYVHFQREIFFFSFFCFTYRKKRYRWAVATCRWTISRRQRNLCRVVHLDSLDFCPA